MLTFPVPGGPKSKTPLHGSRIPVKRWGYFKGKSTASFKSRLATSSPTISLNLTLGFSTRISLCKYYANSLSSGISLKSGIPFSTRTSKKSFSVSSSFFFKDYFFLIENE